MRLSMELRPEVRQEFLQAQKQSVENKLRRFLCLEGTLSLEGIILVKYLNDISWRYLRDLSGKYLKDFACKYLKYFFYKYLKDLPSNT